MGCPVMRDLGRYMAEQDRLEAEDWARENFIERCLEENDLFADLFDGIDPELEKQLVECIRRGYGARFVSLVRQALTKKYEAQWRNRPPPEPDYPDEDYDGC